MKFAFLFVICAAACAQTFDVVSIKSTGPVPHLTFQPGEKGVFQSVQPFRFTPGRVTCNLPLRSILNEAFGIKDWQLSGPDWLGEQERFQIDATMPADTTRTQAWLMLQTMLADRFGLKFHRDMKDTPVYALLAARNGPKLAAVPSIPGGYSYSPGNEDFHANAIPISRFAEALTQYVDRPVIDMTGIEGTYKIEMRWSPDAGIDSALGQLGLRIEKRTMPYEVIIVDHLERVPTAN